MLKTIKKAKKPFSWFLLACVLNFSALAFIFNFEIQLPKIKISFDKGNIEMGAPDANAGTKATTTVQVRNAPPEFTGNAAEVPTSTVASPTNINTALSFVATASDNENNDFYLAICKTNSITASSTGGAPSCAGGQTVCVSGAVAAGSQASCNYVVTETLPTESVNWYAFVCDNHPSQADCSTANTGSGDNGSPYVVNHGPDFTAVATVNNNREPGQVVTFTTTSEDLDAERADTLTLYVCDSNGGAQYGVGCTSGTQLCTETGSSTDIQCNYDIPVPKHDEAYNWYAYVYDNHGATSTANPRTTTYTVINVAPSVGTVFINNQLDTGTLGIKGGSGLSIPINATITDNNGCEDLSSGTSTAYYSAVANGYACASSTDSCYFSSSCAYSGCQAGTSIATLQCTTTLQFNTNPTADLLGVTPFEAGNWLGRLTAIDDDNAFNSDITPDGIETAGTVAVDVTEELINYQTVKSGQNTGERNATTTINNMGNTALDTDVQGTDMEKGIDTIPVGQQEFNELTNFTWSTGTDLAAGDQKADVNIQKPTDGDIDKDAPIYWGIGIPGAQPSGDYTGQNTFTARQGDDGDW